MDIIPVIDLKNGLVVRGVGGRREEYRPIQSKLTDSCQPLEVARTFRDQFDITELYVADLDAIGGAQPAWPILESLLNDGFKMLVDAGLREPQAAIDLARFGVQHVIAGLETLPGPTVLTSILGALGSGPVVFSLDMKARAPLGRRAEWADADALAIAEEAAALGVRHMILLDLAAVGSGNGTGTEELCRTLRLRHPQVRLITGGGIRGADDLRRQAELGVSAVLVASALHHGRIRRADLSAIADQDKRR
jgi:phosphoribosylformimino-5-aminoimidazole carboxamide ribotide isomerase